MKLRILHHTEQLSALIETTFICRLIYDLKQWAGSNGSFANALLYTFRMFTQ